MNMQNKKQEIYDALTESEQNEVKIKKALEAKSKELEEAKEEKDIMFSQMQEMLEQMKLMKEQVEVLSSASPQVITEHKAKVRNVQLMSLSIGQCHLVDGMLNARFDKAFDIIPLRETIFQDFFYRFKTWFDDMEIIILDPEFAEEYGMKNLYDKNGITSDFMDKALEGTAEQMLAKVKNMIPKHRLVFVKYFAAKSSDGDERAKDSTKHYALEKYINETFNFKVDINEIAEQFK